MKKQEKRMLLILVIVSALIITIIWFATRNKENNNVGGTGTTTENVEQGEFTKVEADGTIVNTSEKLKQTKENLGFSITNINFMKKGNETILTARVTETENGEAIDIETTITESYANAYDFRLEK